MKRSGPIKRKTPLRRTGGPARSAGLRRKSVKTEARDDEYRALRLVFIGPGDRCQAAGLAPVACSWNATDVHHTMGRSARYFLDVATWLRLCRPCHQWVTDHPEAARKAGLSHHRRGEPLPMKNHYSLCRSCQGAMYWARTEAGSSIPLDADPTTRRPAVVPDDGQPGRVVAAGDGQTELFAGPDVQEPFDAVDLSVRVLGRGADATPGFPVWRSHFASCPNADSHRKSGR